MEYRKSARVSMKAHPEFNEKWSQQQIASDVTGVEMHAVARGAGREHYRPIVRRPQ